MKGQRPQCSPFVPRLFPIRLSWQWSAAVEAEVKRGLGRTVGIPRTSTLLRRWQTCSSGAQRDRDRGPLLSTIYSSLLQPCRQTHRLSRPYRPLHVHQGLRHRKELKRKIVFLFKIVRGYGDGCISSRCTHIGYSGKIVAYFITIKTCLPNQEPVREVNKTPFPGHKPLIQFGVSRAAVEATCTP